MRLRSAPAIALGVAAATMAPATPADAAPARSAVADAPGPASDAPGPAADQQPSCGDSVSADFPIGTRLHGGPDTYRPGGGFKNWYLDLANATDESCHNIHPVIVMVSAYGDHDEPTSAPARPRAPARFEFYDDGAKRWRSVPFEKTDEDERIGVFGDGATGFTGFTVPARKTVTVKVRLAFAAGALPGDVLANAAVVQRHGDDGEWVGESNAYRFTIAERDADADADGDEDVDADADADSSRDPARDPDADPDTDSDPDPNPDGTNNPTPTPSDARTPPIAPPRPDALAMTGRTPVPVLALGTTAGALLLAGGALMVGSRRFRARVTRLTGRRS